MTQFQHGICGCFDDITTCLITYVAPCWTAGKNAEAMGENCILYGIAALTCVNIITNGLIRQKVREKYGIEGSFGMDVVCHCFCPLCALVQDAQEIKSQGGPGVMPGGNSMARE